MTILYPYQQQGVEYLVKRGGGFLWDEPGLGKTRQAIVAAKNLKGPVLVVCPNALKSWWRKEIRTVYPNDRVLVADVGGRFGNKKHPIKLQDLYNNFPFWVIVHYTGMRLNREELGGIPWSVVIADECHYIKNRDAERTKAMLAITPELAYRIGLTATPFGKNPADLWSQLHWMVPTSKALKSYWRFFNIFVDSDVEHVGGTDTGRAYRKVKGGKNLELLAELMTGFGIQRTKELVVPDLPPLTETALPLTLEGHQKTVYDKMLKAEGEAQLGEVAIVIPNVLARFTRLEQWLSHPWLYDPKTTGVKYDWLMEWAEQYRHSAVIATHYKESARRIAKDLHCRAPITGDLPLKLRDPVIDDWTQGKHQFLVGTIDTIGTGLNLQQAHVMVCYDQVHDPIHMEQLKHRIHRVVTDHPVQIIYPYAEHTTNEVVYNSFTHRLQQMEFVKLFLQHLQGKDESDD